MRSSLRRAPRGGLPPAPTTLTLAGADQIKRPLAGNLVVAAAGRLSALTGAVRDEGAAEVNLGTLVPDEGLENGTLVRGLIPARCDERGLLLIGDPPEMGSAVLPGNNYHVYDIPLFWANLQADVARRVAAWTLPR